MNSSSSFPGRLWFCLCNCCHGHGRKESFTWRGHHLNPRILRFPTSSFNRRRVPDSSRRRLRPEKKLQKHQSFPSESKLETVIDLDDVGSRVSVSLRKLLGSSQARVQGVLSSGKEAFRDLQTLITIENNKRIIVACRLSSLEFMANAVVWTFCIVFAVKFLVKLRSLFGSGLNWGKGFGEKGMIKRDRSLGGREVVVERRFKQREIDKRVYWDRISPLLPVRGTKIAKSLPEKRDSRVGTLPKWWPDSLPSPVAMVDKQEFQREADRLIQAIMDNRMSGKDFTEDDVIQLRRICRISGARVSIVTTNARDSLYRASVDFVLKTCSSATCSSTPVQIDGEDAPQFVAGIAENIGLEDILAARIVCAAVAARTRSIFLQAWALEIQGKKSEALEELLKICLIHQIFPPEEQSPEMEMVARGLEKHLRVEQREQLLNLHISVCGAQNQRIAAEALGLPLPPKEGC